MHDESGASAQIFSKRKLIKIIFEVDNTIYLSTHYRCCAIRASSGVTLWNQAVQEQGWLLAERPAPGAEADATETPAADQPEGKAEKIKDWFSTLPAETSLEQLVMLAHARWVIEQFHEDAKQECGLDHYQGRQWEGLHRHLALVMLAYRFLMLQRLTLPLPPDKAFPPCVTRNSLPGVHLLWLFQDLILWLLHTRQAESFRPRRN